MALEVRDYILVGDGLLVSFNDNSKVSLTYRVKNSRLVVDGDLTQEQEEVLTAFVSNNVESTIPKIDARLRQFDSNGLSTLIATTYKSYTLTTGNPDTYYLAGYYDFNDTSASLSQLSSTISFGSANNAYAAHACIVAGGPGTVVGGGQVGLRVTGTSINDSGTRIVGDSEVIVSDITELTLDQFVEGKKFVGTINFELFVVSGSPTSYSLDFNYGYAKYEDFGNSDFTVTDLECVGRAASGDPDFDIILYHHSTSGWIYAATGFIPGGDVIVSLKTDHSVDNALTNNVRFAYKRAGLSYPVSGADSEGIVIAVITTSGGAVEIMDAHLGVR